MPFFNDRRAGKPTTDISSNRYVVQKGDSVWNIADKNKPAGMSTAKYYTQLMNANKGNFKSGNPSLIYSGERLNLPGQGPARQPKPEKPARPSAWGWGTYKDTKKDWVAPDWTAGQYPDIVRKKQGYDK